MYPTTIAALFLASSASLTQSVPTLDLDEFTNITENGHLEGRGGSGGYHCAYPTTYDLSMAPIRMYENPVLVAGMTVGPDPATAAIVAGYTYTVGFSFSGGGSGNIGADGLSRIAKKASAQASLSFGVSWTKGAQVSATLYCPANTTCGLTAAAQFLHVEGLETIHVCGWDGKSDATAYPCGVQPATGCFVGVTNPGIPFPFVSDFPVKFDNSLVDGQDSIITDFNVCAYGYPDGNLTQCPSNVEIVPGMTCNIEECTEGTCETMCTNLHIPLPSPTCQWSATLGCSWCNCRPYFCQTQ